MAKRIALMTLILSLAGLLVVAGILYRDLSPALAPDRLAVQPPATEPSETPTADKPLAAPEETTAPATEPRTVPAPDFTVYDKDGNPHRLSDFFGKPIVLNFWVSWCGPCQMEMPHFQKKFLEHGQDVQFLMVNVTDGQRETVESASRFLQQAGYTFPVYFDTQLDAADTYGIFSYPMSFLINKDGHLVAHVPGPVSEALLQQGIDMIA